MPSVKELRYFDSLSRVKRATPPRCIDERDQCFLERIIALSARCYIDLDGYSRLFEPKGSLLSGDITPAYSMLNDELIERIAIRFANLKVIFWSLIPSTEPGRTCQWAYAMGISVLSIQQMRMRRFEIC